MIIYDNLKISDILNSSGEDYISFRKRLKIRPGILAFDIILPWLMIISSILLLTQIENTILNIIKAINLRELIEHSPIYKKKAYSAHSNHLRFKEK